jgi:hypothetical protein
MSILSLEHLPDLFLLVSNIVLAIPTFALALISFKSITAEEHRHEEKMAEIDHDRGPADD